LADTILRWPGDGLGHFEGQAACTAGDDTHAAA
jgi:hypothetical protein